MGANGSKKSAPDGKTPATTAEQRRARLVASKLAPLMVDAFHDPDAPTLPPALKLDADGDESVAFQTLRRLTQDPQVADLFRKKRHGVKDIEKGLVKLIRHQEVNVREADLLWATLAGEWPVPAGDAAAVAAIKRSWPVRQARRAWGRVQQAWAAVRLGAVIAVVLLAAERYGATWRGPGPLTLIEVFAVAVLSFFPGWLFVRFIGFRASAVWDEYVLNLHRLGVDVPQYLPRPPINSVYYAGWVAAGGPILARQTTIYQQKFDAYYGRSVSRSGRGTVRMEALFPLFLFTAVVTVGWTAVMWRDGVLGTAAPIAYSSLDLMAFAFMGAYVFTIQMLVRRFFQADLKSSAYAASFVRMAAAIATVAVLDRAGGLGDGTVRAAVAFLVGSFPLMGLQILVRLVAKGAKTVVPVLDFPHPLSDIEGLSIWYEARLLEEGIEDMQNLLTANLPEVILHSRVPVGRLVDWLDQAHLFMRLPPLEKKDRKAPNASFHPRCVLRRIGVRNASGFLEAFPLDADGALDQAGLTSVDAVKKHLSAEQVATISRIIKADPAMETVWQWRCWKTSLP